LTDIAALTDLIKPEADALGFDLVRVQFVSGAEEPTLQIMAERPETGQLGIDDCAALSRRSRQNSMLWKKRGATRLTMPIGWKSVRRVLIGR